MAVGRRSRRKPLDSRPIGARRVAAEQMHEHGTRWVLMTDPEANECCVCDGGQGTGAP